MNLRTVMYIPMGFVVLGFLIAIAGLLSNDDEFMGACVAVGFVSFGCSLLSMFAIAGANIR